MSYTTKEIIETYHKASYDIATFIAKLQDYKRTFEYISQEAKDNCDTGIEAGECLEKLATLLASVVIYENEYEEDLNKDTH